jgi:hypothetical protein
VRLIGDEDTSFALNVVSYQFPEADDYWDANWLIIRVEVRNHEGKWSATGAVLLTGEAAKLADWLEAPIGELGDRGTPARVVSARIAPGLG